MACTAKLLLGCTKLSWSTCTLLAGGVLLDYRVLVHVYLLFHAFCTKNKLASPRHRECLSKTELDLDIFREIDVPSRGAGDTVQII